MKQWCVLPLQSWSCWRCSHCQKIWLLWICPGMNISLSYFTECVGNRLHTLSGCWLHLFYDRNKLGCVPDWMCESSKLEVLDINHNSIAELPVRYLHTHTQLQLWIDDHDRISHKCSFLNQYVGHYSKPELEILAVVHIRYWISGANRKSLLIVWIIPGAGWNVKRENVNNRI